MTFSFKAANGQHFTWLDFRSLSDACFNNGSSYIYAFFLDIDECTAGTHDCSLNALCSNTLGSFKCTCFGGFVGDGVICTGSKENIYF